MNDTKALSFLETTFRAICQDFDCRQQAEARLAQLAMSQSAFGALLDLAVDTGGHEPNACTWWRAKTGGC